MDNVNQKKITRSIATNDAFTVVGVVSGKVSLSTDKERVECINVSRHTLHVIYIIHDFVKENPTPGHEFRWKKTQHPATWDSVFGQVVNLHYKQTDDL